MSDQKIIDKYNIIIMNSNKLTIIIIILYWKLIMSELNICMLGVMRTTGAYPQVLTSIHVGFLWYESRGVDLSQ